MKHMDLVVLNPNATIKLIDNSFVVVYNTKIYKCDSNISQLEELLESLRSNNDN